MASEKITALEDAEKFNVLHPLKHSWTLWFDSPKKEVKHKDWMLNLKQVATFRTVEDFWGVYNNIAPISQLLTGSTFHLFKEGIKPMWEDKNNEKGGKWACQVPKNMTNDLDDIWMNVVLSCIGGELDENGEVCGAVIAIRPRQNRIALWTKTASDRKVTENIGRSFKNVLKTKQNIGYQVHSESILKNTSFTNKELYLV